ncbi:MAG: hypothetical protein QM500_18185 [Methylococcales bacterium]
MKHQQAMGNLKERLADTMEGMRDGALIFTPEFKAIVKHNEAQEKELKDADDLVSKSFEIIGRLNARIEELEKQLKQYVNFTNNDVESITKQRGEK